LSIAPQTDSTLTVYGFKATDAIDLSLFPFGSGLKHSFTENAAKKMGVLTITDGGLKVTVDLFGQYVAAGFHLAKSGAGTAITYSEPPAAHAEISVSHT
jgi:hypothetical protein